MVSGFGPIRAQPIGSARIAQSMATDGGSPTSAAAIRAVTRRCDRAVRCGRRRRREQPARPRYAPMLRASDAVGGVATRCARLLVNSLNADSAGNGLDPSAVSWFDTCTKDTPSARHRT